MLVKEVTLGVSTVNDHERRITELEEKVKQLLPDLQQAKPTGPEPEPVVVAEEPTKKRGRPPRPVEEGM
jgi:hypothetical protein